MRDGRPDRCWLTKGRTWPNLHPRAAKRPVIRQPFGVDDRLPFWAYTNFVGTLAFDLGEDPAEEQNRAGDALGKDLADVLREALRAVEAPDDQLVRLGY